MPDEACLCLEAGSPLATARHGVERADAEHGYASLAALIEDLKSFSGIQPLPAPAGFSGELRPYQQEGSILQFCANPLGESWLTTWAWEDVQTDCAHSWRSKAHG